MPRKKQLIRVDLTSPEDVDRSAPPQEKAVRRYVFCQGLMASRQVDALWHEAAKSVLGDDEHRDTVSMDELPDMRKQVVLLQEQAILGHLNCTMLAVSLALGVKLELVIKPDICKEPMTFPDPESPAARHMDVFGPLALLAKLDGLFDNDNKTKEKQ